jgi:hypothetical protein
MVEVCEIIHSLKKKYPQHIEDNYLIPSPWCINKHNVKAILLGCDPSNNHIHNMPFVFCLGIDISIFNSFKKSFEDDLNEIGLGWDNVYVQNLCKNYFDKETGKNPIWFKAAEYWIPNLVDELTSFKEFIPVLLTSEVLLKALVYEYPDYGSAIDFYECRNQIPIPAKVNKLKRPLIPFYRGRNPKINKSYRINSDNWEQYKERIVEILSNNRA